MRFVALAPLVLLAAGCATQERPSADADRERLLARVTQFHDAIREGDKDAYADVFVDDFVFTWSRDGRLYDREAILPNVVPTPDFAPLVDEEIVRIRGDAAIVCFRVRKSADDTGARVTFSCARIDGAWKVLASHGTPIAAPTAPIAPDDPGDGAEDAEAGADAAE